MTRQSSSKDPPRCESDRVAAHFQQDQQKKISHCGDARHHSNFAQMDDSLNSKEPKNRSRLAKTKALIDLLTAAAWRAQSGSAMPRTFDVVNVEDSFVALSFDDGPHPILTPKLLDLLGRRGIRATFFVVGKHVVKHPEVVARAAREGHEIGNHSWSHPDFQTMSDESVRQQLRDAEHAIAKATDKMPTLMRPPFGSISERQKQWIHREFRYQTIMWDVDSLDWKRPGPARICSRIAAETRAGSIVLCHDNHPETVAAMEDTLTQLDGKGFKFVTVSELIARATSQTPPAASRTGWMRSLRMLGLRFTKAAGSRHT
jgi:peptidoglycan/xylan/chitin deacetylase (PgdA/CDA1 family)